MSIKLKYPSLYFSSNALSVKSQKQYKITVAFHILSLILSAILVSFFKEYSGGRIAIAFIVFISFLINLALVFINKNKDWYTARAIAESVKTLTWRYSMKSEPYNISESEDRKRFLQDLKKIIEQNRNVTEKMETELEDDQAIDSSMNQLRELNLTDRIEHYLKWRIKEQLQWYSSKAIYNRKCGDFWYGIFLLSNLLLLLFSLIHVANPKFDNHFYDLFPTVIAGIFSWIQIQKFRDLASAYNMTAQEITLIRGDSYYVDNENSFSNFVADSENAFSREHTQWIARRDT